MTEFIPEGYMPIPHAAEAAARTWREAEWGRLDKLDHERASLRGQQQLAGLKQRSGEQLSSEEAALLDRKPAKSAEDIKSARGALVTTAWLEIRQALFAGRLPFFVQTETWGTVPGVGTAVWGSGKAQRAPSRIVAECVVPKVGSTFVEGLPLVSLDSFSRFLKGQPPETEAASEESALAPSIDPPVPPRSGGRLPKYDWQAIHVEIARILFHGPDPKSKNELVERVLDWHQEKTGSSDLSRNRTELKKAVAAFWTPLRESDPT